MKKAIIILISFTVLLVVISVAGYAYYGGFEKIHVETKQAGGEIFVYEEHIGPYSETGKIADKMYYALLNEDKIETFRGCGIFYDNPKHVESDKLRSEVGCILENLDEGTIQILSKKYKIKTIPKTGYICAEFPFKGMPSIIIGIIKVYPALNDYSNEIGINENSPVTEIYDIPNEKIIYRKEMAEK